MFCPNKFLFVDYHFLLIAYSMIEKNPFVKERVQRMKSVFSVKIMADDD